MMVLSCSTKGWVDHVTSGKAGLTTDYRLQQPYKRNCSDDRGLFLASLHTGIHKSAHLSTFEHVYTHIGARLTVWRFTPLPLLCDLGFSQTRRNWQ